MANTTYTIYGDPIKNEEMASDEAFSSEEMAAILDLHANMEIIIAVYENQGWVFQSGENAASAAASAVLSEGYYNAFRNSYLGAYTVPPVTTPTGAPLSAGMLYFNSTTYVMFVYGASDWQASSGGTGEGGGIPEPVNNGNIYGRTTTADGDSSWERVAPFGHNHAMGDVVDLLDTLEAMADDIEDLSATATVSTPGLVPAPGSSTNRFLRDDLSWATPAGGGGGGIVEAPQDNKYYSRRNAAWAETVAKVHTHVVADITDFSDAMILKSDADHVHAVFNATDDGFAPKTEGATGFLDASGAWIDPLSSIFELDEVDATAEDMEDGNVLVWDFDTQTFIPAPQSGGNGGDVPVGGNNGDVLTKVAGSPDWAVPRYIPSGGNTDDVLKKVSGNNYDVVWGAGSGGVTWPLVNGNAVDGLINLGAGGGGTAATAKFGPVSGGYPLKVNGDNAGRYLIFVDGSSRVGAFASDGIGLHMDFYDNTGATRTNRIGPNGIQAGAGTAPSSSERLRVNGDMYLNGVINFGPTAGEVYTNPLRIGEIRLWDDGTKLRAKRGSAPSTNTDGTVLY